MTTFKIGDPVKVYSLKETFRGTITGIINNGVFVTEDGFYSAHNDSPFHVKQCRKLVKKLSEKDKAMSEQENNEIKLEVGKKYDVSYSDKAIAKSSPYRLLTIDENDLVFRDSRGVILIVYKSVKANLKFKEHREPYKNTFTGYIREAKENEPHSITLQTITGGLNCLTGVTEFKDIDAGRKHYKIEVVVTEESANE